MPEKPLIKAIIGLGNPGSAYMYTRHNIGFRVLDSFAHDYGLTWSLKKEGNYLFATLTTEAGPILLIKPQNFMNNSGDSVHFLRKKGIMPENILVVHDELELPCGKIQFKEGGSHKGHNGLRSLMTVLGPSFIHLRIGIGRPEHKDDVPSYVLQPFESLADNERLTILGVNALKGYLFS